MLRCLLQVIEFIKSHHSYDTPEIIAMPLTAGLPDYLNWVLQATASVDEKTPWPIEFARSNIVTIDSIVGNG
jgi:hypothetical protein